jgi:hypothetical protein
MRWARLAIRLRRLRKRIERDPAAAHYTDEGLKVAADSLDNFVEVFADRIPKTYGAPARRAVAN